MKKSVFKDNFGNIHFGISVPTGFEVGTKKDIEVALEDLDRKRFWRCHVCNDLSITSEPFRDCPTCHALNAYIEIELSEFKKILELL